VVGFPGLGLLRTLRPAPQSSVDGGPCPPPALAGPAGRATLGRFPRSPAIRLAGSAPGYAPTASPRVRRRPSSWPPHRLRFPASESPPHPGGRCVLLPGPDPPDSSRFQSLRGFNHRFTPVAPCLPCLPGPAHLAVLDRPVVVRAASHPTSAPPLARLPSASPDCCDNPAVGPSTHPNHSRLVAHGIATERVQGGMLDGDLHVHAVFGRRPSPNGPGPHPAAGPAGSRARRVSGRPSRSRPCRCW
jgi:hypothetical protein